MTYPLSQTQMGIYVTCMNTEEEGNYNIDMLYKLDDDIDIDRLANALDKVIEAHPYVKSRLVTDDNGDVVFEDHSTDEFHTSIFEINDIEDVRHHLGEDYDLLHDQLFRLEIYKTKAGNYLYVDFHHIVFDGMSFAVFRGDVAKAYTGETLDGEPKNGFKIATEEAEVRKSEVYTEARDWYAREFGAASEAESMPIADVFGDNPEHFVTIWHQLNIDKDALQTLCDKAGVKESMVFTAGFGYTLSKYTGDEEALYTSVFHGRSDKATRRAFCMMVKTLPVYHDFRKTPTVVELLQQTSTQTAGTRKRTCYSYGEVHTDLGLQSEVCFVYQGNLTTLSLFLDGREQSGEDLRRHRAGIKLSVQIITKDGGYYVKAEYPDNRFSAAFINTFCKTYNTILSEMLVKEKLADIECCDEKTLAGLDSFNNPVSLSDEEKNATVLSMFQKAAKEHPDNIAVVFKDTRITYKELDERTDRIAEAIMSKVNGQKSEGDQVVSIIIHRNEWMVLASLAALKAGCAYQPLDPSYPQERLNFMVKDASAVLLIADADLRPIVNEYEGEVLLTSDLGKFGESLARPSGRFHSDSGERTTGSDPEVLALASEQVRASKNWEKEQHLSPHSLLTLLYTSGSTGVPKGVMLEHQNLIAFCKSFARYCRMDSTSQIAAYASFGFDANMMDIYCTLMIGATLHIIDEEIRLDLEALYQYFEREGITNCFMTTQVGVQYLESYPQSNSLHDLVMGGEKLRAIKPEELSYRIHNGYGPSETTCGCALFHIQHWEPNIPIGKPTDTCSLYIVDKHGHRLPIGAPGELWINGPQVGRGYLNRPDKTAECFTANPFGTSLPFDKLRINSPQDEPDSAQGNGRVYHSGDIVRYREDGNIEFVGRKDGQVKIRGFRIELKEVEAVIRDFPGIKDVTVQAFDDPNGGKFIAAYIVSGNVNVSVNIDALSQFILDQKPPYMVPAVTMQIDKIPLTVNQKVDRKALPKPERSRSTSTSTSAPMNRLEVELYNMLAGILNIPALTEDGSQKAVMSITDRLAYFGLSSISSIKLATLIYKRFAIQIDSKALAKEGTLLSIENELLEQWMEGGFSDAQILGNPGVNHRPFAPDLLASKARTLRSALPLACSKNPAPLTAPLTFSQIGVYTECIANPQTTLYNIPLGARIPASITAQQLEQALQTFVSVHPCLWTHFITDGEGNVLQTRMADTSLNVEHIYLSDDNELQQCMKDFVRPFDLATGPLFRFAIVEITDSLNPQPSTLNLLADFHHLVSDGASCDIFLQELCQALEGKKLEREDYDYYTFATEQKISDGDKEYFDGKLSGLEDVSMFIPDNTDAGDDSHRISRVSSKINITALEKRATNMQGVTTAGICLALTNICISKYLSDDEVSLCTISNGRSDVRLHNTVGMFVNTLPVVAKMQWDENVKDYLLRTSADYAETLQHEYYPFARVAQDYGFKANIMFAYQIGVVTSYNIGKEQLSLLSLTLEKAKFPVYISVNGTMDEAEVVVEYDSSLYTEEMMQGLADAYSNLADQIACKEKMNELSITSDKMLQQLDTFNAGYMEHFDGEHQDIVTLFRKAAALYPNNKAVVYQDKIYTYKELDELTDRIGARIKSSLPMGNVSAPRETRGLEGSEETIEGGEDLVVSILIPRSELMVVTALSALKAGCAYQPLDPSYPQERLNFMVKDACAALLIADAELRPIVNEYEGEVLLTSDMEKFGESLAQPSGRFHSDSGERTTGSDPDVSENLEKEQHLSPDSLFILLYTSGSTGVPKGVMLEHRNLVAFCDWYRKYYSLKPGDCVGAYASFGFDACMMDMYPALTTGATVCIAPEDLRLDLVSLNEYYRKNGVTHAFMTTQVGVQFLLNIKDTCLKHLSVGGEKLVSVDPAVGYTFHNGYGPTECTIFSTTYAVDKRENNIPIGNPTCHLKCYVMDRYLHRLPIGAAGELIISGRQVGRGYLNCPEKTAEAFFTLNGMPAYHSGDIVRYRNDGNIEFVGRKDGQVKIRGFRIELKEVEEVIRRYQGIKDVTVQAFDDPNGGKFIAAYIVSVNVNVSVNIDALSQFILDQKPPYMVPAVTMQIDEIPLNVNQKVDKKALPKPERSTSAFDYVAPQGHLEETIAKCIADTLGLDPLDPSTGAGQAPVSANDSFPSLGGTSIKAIRLMALLKNEGIEIPIDQLLRHNDVRTLSLIADYASRGEYVDRRTALMPAQMRMLHEHLQHPDRHVGAICAMLDVDKIVTEELLRKAIDMVARKNPVTTSAVAFVGTDLPQQVYLSGRQVPLYVIEAENKLDAVEKMDDLRLFMLDSVCNIQTNPLVQVALCSINGEASHLLISCNTILAERWKIRAWIAELFATLKDAIINANPDADCECIDNWSFILAWASPESIDPSLREDWSKEQQDNNSSWSDMELVNENDNENDNYKVLTNTQGTKQLVFVHTGNTGCEAYLSLAGKLEGYCSFAVLDQWNLYHQDDIKHGIPEIARKYIEVLQAHQPHGPYYLGGWCYGGMIAYEMACQLTDAGEEVEQLFMFDAHTVSKQRFKDMFTSKTGDNMRQYFENSPLFEGLINRGLIDSLVANSLQVNYDMMQFHPRMYDGNVVYFKAITPAPGLKGRMAEYFKDMNSKRAGGYEKYIPQDKLHIVDIRQEHDNLMNEASLSIEIPVMKQYLSLPS